MKLYYSPAVCSLAPHIVLNELGVTYELERVDLKTKKTEHGEDYSSICEKSAVPMLLLDNSEQLGEGVAIIQYLADLHPEKKLAAPNGSFERVRLQEMLNYIASDFHKSHFPFFSPECGDETRAVYKKKIQKCYDYLSGILEKKPFLMGDDFTVADAYAFTVINWHRAIKLDISPWPTLVRYQETVSKRPTVQAAMKAEGLIGQKAA